MNIYILQHVRDEDWADSLKMCGVFSTSQKAEEARDSLLFKPGFREYKDGFSISEYEIDRLWWSDGFGFDSDE